MYVRGHFSQTHFSSSVYRFVFNVARLLFRYTNINSNRLLYVVPQTPVQVHRRSLLTTSANHRTMPTMTPTGAFPPNHSVAICRHVERAYGFRNGRARVNGGHVRGKTTNWTSELGPRVTAGIVTEGDHAAADPASGGSLCLWSRRQREMETSRNIVYVKL